MSNARTRAARGRRRQNYRFERESTILASFFARASVGGILVVPQIKVELEAALGRSMALSSVASTWLA